MKIHSKKDKILLDRLEESKGMKRLGGYINRKPLSDRDRIRIGSASDLFFTYFSAIGSNSG